MVNCVHREKIKLRSRDWMRFRITSYFCVVSKNKRKRKASPNRLFGRSLINFLIKNPILKFKESVLNDAKEKFDDDEEKLVLFENASWVHRRRISETKTWRIHKTSVVGEF